MSSERLEIFQYNFRQDVTYDIIKSHKKQRFTLSQEVAFFEKPQGGSN